MEKEIQFKGGLRPLKKDKRDFQYHQVFGAITPPEEDFVVGTPLEIKNQFDSDFCTAFASCYVSEFQEKVKLSPEYQFAKTKEIEGNYSTWGADLRTTCKSFVKFGSLEKKDAKYSLENSDRDFVADWKNWSFENDIQAIKHRKASYFSIGQGSYQDLFDALRAALWQNRAYNRAVLTGCLWRASWNSLQDGVIPKNNPAGQFGHAFCFMGQKKINGEWHLVALMSNGEETGDNGYYYFPREVVNRECRFGNFMFVDMTPEAAKKLCWGFAQKVIHFCKSIFYAIKK